MDDGTYQGLLEYRAWLLSVDDEHYDEYLEYQLQCVNADIFAYQSAKEAYARGDEYMPDNPYEEGIA